MIGYSAYDESGKGLIQVNLKELLKEMSIYQCIDGKRR